MTEPTRHSVRIETVLPNSACDNTDIALPQRKNSRIDIELDRCIWSQTLIKPVHATAPITDKCDPSLADARRLRLEPMLT
jgi:hypothetical protein